METTASHKEQQPNPQRQLAISWIEAKLAHFEGIVREREVGYLLVGGSPEGHHSLIAAESSAEQYRDILWRAELPEDDGDALDARSIEQCALLEQERQQGIEESGVDDLISEQSFVVRINGS
jgi:hypothetical protein